MNPVFSFRNRVVLLGAGHTNAHVIRMWGMGHAIENTELVVVSNFPVATYSGMLPAVLAGDVGSDLMQIDLHRLCHWAGARLIIDNCETVNRDVKTISFPERPPLHYDVLAIGIGSRPTFKGVELSEKANLVQLKPMQQFLRSLTRGLLQIPDGNQQPVVAIVGGGVASFEIACCLKARFHKATTGDATNTTTRSSCDRDLDSVLRRFSQVNISVFTSDPEPTGGLSRSAAHKLKQAVRAMGVNVSGGRRVHSVEKQSLRFDDGSQQHFDLVIWATGAAAPELLERIDLPKDPRGFLLTQSSLQSIADPNIFAIGDSGTMENSPTPKAGVYAVRQGPVLFQNLKNVIENKPVAKYLPQAGFLKLVNLGHKKALADYRGLSWLGHGAWKTKLRIDTHFMKMYQDLKPMMAQKTMSQSEGTAAMRCLGCGGKIGASVLHASLCFPHSTLNPEANQHVVLGLDSADDAAILRFPKGEVTVSTDYFASPLNDPFLFGRTLVNHSASDLFAMGAQPLSVLANVEIPFGHPQGQQRTLKELMAGIQHELSRLKIALVGGHTIEGPRLAAGLTVLGEQISKPTQKKKLRVGDRLILTKPLGTGIYLAAAMQNKLPGDNFTELEYALTTGNEIALELLQRFHVQAMTDVTGFGLLGHLGEMLTNDLTVEIIVASVPTLSYVPNLLAAGIESTLAPENRDFANLAGIKPQTNSSSTDVLFDPQTCGGLLIAVTAQEEPEALRFLNDHGFTQSSTIGCVIASQEPSVQVLFV